MLFVWGRGFVKIYDYGGVRLMLDAKSVVWRKVSSESAKLLWLKLKENARVFSKLFLAIQSISFLRTTFSITAFM